MSAIDDLINKYANELGDIYDERTAGSYTFTGVLSKFLREVNVERDAHPDSE